MCGIAGIISNEVGEQVLSKMSGALSHRGPDGEGLWINHAGTVGFAHRRLAVIDLSIAAAQPMHYGNRYSIVFNGEIYNHIELRNELRKAGYEFTSASDTEVILAAYDCYKSKCLNFLDGMFAFAIWDEKEKILFAARDRFGEKPFYYWNENPHFVFGSEMKAIWAAGIPKTWDERMMLNYLAMGQVQNPSEKSQTFFSNILSLPPAHYLIWHVASSKLDIVNYWNIDKQIQQQITEQEAISTIDSMLSISVQQRLRSEVPIGGSLSGGVDSTTLAWYISQHQSNYQSFSAVFPGSKIDESSLIDELKKALPHNNYRVTPTGLDMIRDFEKLAWHQEEPFPSSSIYAQFCVHRLAASKGVKVLLDGQGADEIFAGYHRYAHWYLQDLVGHKKFLHAKKERNLLHKNKVNFHWGFNNMVASFLPAHVALALEKKEYHKIIHHPHLNRDFLNQMKGREWEGISKPYVTKLNDILYFNTMQLGLEELLRYSDRNSMAHGIEVRLPFLQPDLVAFVFSLPSSLKIHNGFMKWILRKMMDKRIPDNIVWQKSKTGFEPPQKEWMELPEMKDYIIEARKKLVSEKILQPSVIQQKITSREAHETGNSDWRYLCAASLMKS